MLLKKKILLIIFALISTAHFSLAQQLAFPGAEGFGRFTTGGRGGKVIEVTNLNDSGSGSLREAVEADSARTVVFRISGTIALNSKLTIRNGDITIAGQTAPGDGICIKDEQFSVAADNVIIRYIRFRPGDEKQLELDAIGGVRQKNIIIDHCSMGWAIDEVASFYDNEDFTMQWCIISESLYHSYHSKGNHGYGGIWGGKGASFHHNLLAHHSSRTPRFCGSRYHGEPEKEIVDHRNNVIYNWGFNSAYGGEAGNQNMVDNYYKAGPATDSGSMKYRIVSPSHDDTYGPYGSWYIVDNYIYGYSNITADNWAGGVQGDYWQVVTRVNEPHSYAPVLTQTAENAYELVLSDAGAVLPKRDSVDIRIIEEVRTGTATYGGVWGTGSGIIDSQTDVGGWPTLHSAPAPTDTDHDGMPDDWEIQYGFNPIDPSDNIEDSNNDGYTNIEEYLNGTDPLLTDIEKFKNGLNAETFALMQNYPNPFNLSTTITYSIPTIDTRHAPSLQNVILRVYDVLGLEVATLVNKEQSPGNYEVKFDASNLTSSLYFYKITTNGFTQTKKMMLLK